MRYVPRHVDAEEPLPSSSDSSKHLAALTHSRSERSTMAERPSVINREDMVVQPTSIASNQSVSTGSSGTGRRCLSPKGNSYEKVGNYEKRTLSPRGRQIVPPEERRNVSPRGRQIISVRDDRRSISPSSVESRHDEKRTSSPRGRIAASPRGRLVAPTMDDRRSVSPRGRLISDKAAHADLIAPGAMRRRSVCDITTAKPVEREPQFRAPGGVFRRNHRVPANFDAESNDSHLPTPSSAPSSDTPMELARSRETSPQSSPRVSTAPAAPEA